MDGGAAAGAGGPARGDRGQDGQGATQCDGQPRDAVRPGRHHTTPSSACAYRVVGSHRCREQLEALDRSSAHQATKLRAMETDTIGGLKDHLLRTEQAMEATHGSKYSLQNIKGTLRSRPKGNLKNGTK